MGWTNLYQTLASRVEGVNPNSNCDRRVLYDRWKKPGDRTFFKNIALEENVSNLTTRFVQDYNYFQIGSISLGYEMRRELCRKIGLTGLRFNFNMGDIARFSSVKENGDCLIRLPGNLLFLCLLVCNRV